MVGMHHDGLSRPLANAKLRLLSLGYGVQSSTLALMSAWGMRLNTSRLTCSLFAVFLTGCASTGMMPATPTVATACPQIRTYTPAEEQAAAVALGALMPGNILITFMADYGQLRASARACAQ